jgi:predicted DNA-binding transcriptional regulator YafY
MRGDTLKKKKRQIRLEALARALQDNPVQTVTNLASNFNVDLSVVYRDLNFLRAKYGSTVIPKIPRR